MSFLYRVQDSTALTQPCAAGPWSSSMQHGGAPTSLIAWAAERMATREPMQVVRMTVDLLRPVPIAPLQIRTQVVREGRKIQVCAITLLDDDVEVVRASVLKVRSREVALPETISNEAITLPGPDEGREPDDVLGEGNAFIKGLDLRVVRGGFRKPGPGAIWFRAHRPVVEGAPITPLMRAAMSSDFCNGASSVLDFNAWTFINADLSINLARMPVGEWILLDAHTWLGENGAGVAFAKLGDERGYFGRAVQSLVIEEREGS